MEYAIIYDGVNQRHKCYLKISPTEARRVFVLNDSYLRDCGNLLDSLAMMGTIRSDGICLIEKTPQADAVVARINMLIHTNRLMERLEAHGLELVVSGIPIRHRNIRCRVQA